MHRIIQIYRQFVPRPCLYPLNDPRLTFTVNCIPFDPWSQVRWIKYLNLIFRSESRFPKIKSDSRVGYCFESDQPDSSWFLSFESNCKAAVLNCGDNLNCAYQHMKSYENNNCKGTVTNCKFITSWSSWRPDDPLWW